MPQSLLDHLSARPQVQALPNEQLEVLANQAELATASFGKSFINETIARLKIFPELKFFYDWRNLTSKL